jgi:hypothetical protein
MPMTRNPIPILVAFTIASLLLCLYGCREISPSELSGVWKVTEDSLAHVPPELRAKLGSLTLEPNGAFKAMQVPGDIFDQPGRLVSGKGKWTFLKKERVLRLSLDELTEGAPSSSPATNATPTSARSILTTCTPGSTTRTGDGF